MAPSFLFCLSMMAALFLFLGVSRGGAVDSPAVAGHYVLQGIHEVGSELMLHPDGRFEYMLAYGAYDEYARGNWKLEAGKVVLNTEGGSVPPQFVLKSSTAKTDNTLTILVQDRQGRGLPGIDVLLDNGKQKTIAGYTQYYGLSLPLSQGYPQAIGLGVKMYNLPEQWFPLAGRRDNFFVFEFHPGDLGKVRFHQQALVWDNEALLMERQGQKMRYIKVKPR
jgi:hypothetical protein